MEDFFKQGKENNVWCHEGSSWDLFQNIFLQQPWNYDVCRVENIREMLSGWTG